MERQTKNLKTKEANTEDTNIRVKEVVTEIFKKKNKKNVRAKKINPDKLAKKWKKFFKKKKKNPPPFYKKFF